jgi:ParB-like chromosome segregation protein Spo0J
VRIDHIAMEKIRGVRRRRGDACAVAAIRRSIKQLGLLHRIVIDGDTWRVLDGRRRILALRELGRHQVEALVCDGADTADLTVQVAAHAGRPVAGAAAAAAAPSSAVRRSIAYAIG